MNREYSTLSEGCMHVQSILKQYKIGDKITNWQYHTDSIIEPPTHSMIRDTSREVVFTFHPKPSLSDHQSCHSLGSLCTLIDNITSEAITVVDKKHRNSVTLTLDVKQIDKMPIDKPLTLLIKIVHVGSVYCVTHVQTFDSAGKLLSIADHTKVYVDTKPKL